MLYETLKELDTFFLHNTSMRSYGYTRSSNDDVCSLYKLKYSLNSCYIENMALKEWSLAQSFLCHLFHIALAAIL